MISVALTTYNAEKYIYKQVYSIITQLKENDELIISDNYSTDNTVSIVKSFNDSRIRIIYQKKCSNNNTFNCIKNFENALNNCKGEYIFLSDQDDIWHPNKIYECSKYLKYYDLVVTNCMVIDEMDELLEDSFFRVKNSKKGLINNLISNSYIGCCMAFKNSLLKVALPFPKLIPLHDIFIGFVGECFFKTYYIDEKLSYYRRHNNNLSHTLGKNKFNIFDKIQFRWNIIRYIPVITARYFVNILIKRFSYIV